MNSNTQSQSRRRYARQRPHEVQTGIDSLPIHVNRMPLTDLKIQTEMLIFYFENRPKSIRWCSGKRGLRNGAPYKVSKSTLQRWKNHYFLYGEPPAITKKYQRKSGCCCLTLDQRTLLKQLALDNPECYLDEFQQQMMARGMPKIHPSTIYRYLKREGLSINKLKEIAKERCEVERANFYKMIDGLDYKMFIYMDETAKDKHAGRRRRGWVRTGSDSSILKRFKRSEDRFTLLAALNYKGFLPDACLKIDRTKDNVDIDLFNYYLVNFLIPAMGNFARGEENSILIIDNAPVHDHLEIRRLVEEAGGIVIFTARYSPDINPIEYAFNLYKKLLKRFNNFDSEVAHQMALGGVTEKDLRKTFKHCLPFHDIDLPLDSDDDDENIEDFIIREVVHQYIVPNSV
eukprot:g2151.t1